MIFFFIILFFRAQPPPSHPIPPHPTHFTIVKCLEVWADADGSSDTITSLKCSDYFLASQKFLSGLLMCETLLWHEMTHLMLRGAGFGQTSSMIPTGTYRWRSLRSHASSSSPDWEARGLWELSSVKSRLSESVRGRLLISFPLSGLISRS